MREKDTARMKDKYSTSQLFNFTRDSYLERTSRPIYAIVFLLPFIVFYELGAILIRTDVLNQSNVRVVAFIWLRESLEHMGFAGKFAWMAPPLAVVVILIALQLTSRRQWWFGVRDICPMAIECVLLAIPLIVASVFLSNATMPQNDINQFDASAARIQAEGVLGCSSVANDALSAAEEGGSISAGKWQMLLPDVVTSIGAGIYEELIFRLILICVLMVLFQNIFRLNHTNSVIFAVLVSAALFSAHHHIDFLSGQLYQKAPFSWPEFGFRTIAGVYFAFLFAVRGFGITAGTHAFYDIIATVINAFFFSGPN